VKLPGDPQKKSYVEKNNWILIGWRLGVVFNTPKCKSNFYRVSKASSFCF